MTPGEQSRAREILVETVPLFISAGTAGTRARHEVISTHQLGSGRNGAAGRPVAFVSNRYTSPAVGSA